MQPVERRWDRGAGGKRGRLGGAEQAAAEAAAAAAAPAVQRAACSVQPAPQGGPGAAFFNDELPLLPSMLPAAMLWPALSRSDGGHCARSSSSTGTSGSYRAVPAATRRCQLVPGCWRRWADSCE